MFFTYRQNNSFGEIDREFQFLIVEADDAEEANRIASEFIYFDGCEIGQDCPCCGDRWSRVSDYDGEKSPLIYGKPFEEYEDHYSNEFDTLVAIHYRTPTLELLEAEVAEIEGANRMLSNETFGSTD